MKIEEVPELTLPIIKPNRDYFCQYCDKVRAKYPSWCATVGALLRASVYVCKYILLSLNRWFPASQ